MKKYILFVIFVFTVLLSFIFSINYSNSKANINIIFRHENQLILNDINLYMNFSKCKSFECINNIRRKSKYRKIGYGGHPSVYLFSYPIDSRIIINPLINVHSIELLVFIHCRPEEFYERIISRKSINKHNSVVIIYITSNSNNCEINRKLKHEAYIYNDILQFSEISSYFNLSIQTVHMLIWSKRIKFKYLLKSDIDVYINIPLIYSWITNFRCKYNYCAIGRVSKTHIIRNKKYSHYVPREIIKENFYPKYLQGVGYIIHYNTVKLLTESVKYIKPKIWIEDVFMGYMFKYNNITLIDLSEFILRDIPYNISNIINNASRYMLIHGFYPIELFMLMNMQNR